MANPELLMAMAKQKVRTPSADDIAKHAEHLEWCPVCQQEAARKQRLEALIQRYGSLNLTSIEGA